MKNNEVGLIQSGGKRIVVRMSTIEKNVPFEKVLHSRFVKLGNDRRRLTNELLALLPEIFERKIYKKYAGGILEYAAKFGGLTEGVVRKRLRLEKYVCDKPMLKEAIRTEGIHKVALVASLATKENEKLLVDKLKNLSKPAVQELSKELRARGETNNLGLFEKFEENFVNKSAPCRAIPTRITLELDEEMSTMFLKLKKIYGKNLSNREVMKMVMKEMLEVKTRKIVVRNEKVGIEAGSKTEGSIIKKTSENPIIHQVQSVKVIPGDTFLDKGYVAENINADGKNLNKPITRYVSVPIKRKTLQSTNGKCSYPGCNKPADNIHHPERFSESKNHDNLKPLCKIHHEFMHNGLVTNQAEDSSQWRLSLEADLSFADYSYRRYRRR